MAYIVFDLEFNNLSGITTYHPDFEEEYGEIGSFALKNEIIEIGALKLDAYMKPLDDLKVYIKPSVLPILNPKITEITNITQKDLDKGVSFETAMDILNDFVDDGDVICSWAKDDIAEITSNAKYFGYEKFDFLRKYLDIQEYAMKVYGLKKSLSLKEALSRAQVQINTEKLHDALNDSIFTAEVLRRIYNSRSVKQCITEDIYNLPIFEVEELDVDELDSDKIKLQCPKCKQSFELEYELKYMGWRYVGLGGCKKCRNRIKVELLLKRTLANDTIYNEIDTIVKEEEYSRLEQRMKK